ncbi:GTPase/DUF3482 domain-containing protein [Salinibius halmophilus]|uniref:GTPase/DUF3482 domain-containing protein n=1 Tax=Salinibius halmophilus TaxID=1853216 RepID=UPI0013140824|nr:GTPase/DUF3482 domain-containing protein [Salinibius halmophilus]
MNLPKLAIVGHPNRGKSSLVATLTEDERIAISPVSGTTEVAEPFNLSVADTPYLTLVDTPGFQRARRLLEMLGGDELPLDQRPNAIQSFLADINLCQQFPDEAALLAPIVDGAGILYVVDGGRPYEEVYAPEMELLRWTSAPRMAVINPIGSDRHVAQWQQVLNQQFQVVRVFNPLASGFNTRMQLFNAFSILAPQWQHQLQDLQAVLAAARQSRALEAAGWIARLLNQSLSFKVSVIGQGDLARTAAEKRLLSQLAQQEQACWHNIASAYRFSELDLSIDQLSLPEDDLFNQQAWQLWGLSRKQLWLAAGASGALAGGALDLAVGGTSLLMGTVTGAGVASAGAFWADRKLAKLGWAKQLLGSKESWQCGPVKHANFGFVLLARALVVWLAVDQRTHAQRDRIVLQDMQSQLWQKLSLKEQGQWLRLFAKMQQAPLADKQQAELAEQILALFEKVRSELS